MSSFKNKEFIISYAKKSGGKAIPSLINSAESWDTIQNPDSFFLSIPQHLNYFLCDLNVVAEAPDITSSPNNTLRWWAGVAASSGKSVFQIPESTPSATILHLVGAGQNYTACPCVNITGQGHGIATFAQISQDPLLGLGGSQPPLKSMAAGI